MDVGNEAAVGLVIAGGDLAELLMFVEEALDQVPRVVEVAVVAALPLPGALRPDNRRLPGPVRGNEYPYPSFAAPAGSASSPSRSEADPPVSCSAVGIVECLRHPADLRAQTVPAALDRLLTVAPLFSRPGGVLVRMTDGGVDRRVLVIVSPSTGGRSSTSRTARVGRAKRFPPRRAGYFALAHL